MIRVEIEKTDAVIEGDKRQEIPAILRWWCPVCNEVQENDYADGEHLYYPKIGEPFDTTVYCENCDEIREYTVRLRIDMTLNVVEVKDG